jgi:putative ABC transport system ATP-binding protein
MAKKPIISIRHMNVTYFPGRSNEVKALQDINLDIFPGEYIIFFGPSGCGKSTLLYSIAGLERNVEGDIVVKDKNLSDMDLHQLEAYHQQGVGMIFQSFYLIASLSVAQNVALPQVAVRKAKADRLKQANELLTKFGVGAQANKLPTELSGGQQQRVAICRSLMNNPDIIIADEPVGNLDSKSTKDVMELLRHLNDEEKKAVILVTHDPSHLFHAHRIFYLRDGKIIGTKVNTPEERMQPTTTGLQSTVSHWARAYATAGGAKSQVADNAGDLMYKSEEIFAEVLAHLTADEVAELEGRIQQMLQKGETDKRSIISFLRRPLKKGGIGMGITRAGKVAEEIITMAKEVKKAAKLATAKATKKAASEDDLPLTVVESSVLSTYVLDIMNLSLSGMAAAKHLEEVIRQRLEQKIDQAHVQRLLMLPVKKKGVGLGARTARKVAHKIELIVTSPSQNGPAAIPTQPLSAPASPAPDESE